MMLIGLAGVARSGKDTAAAVLAKELGLYRYAFADPIKRMLEQVFGDNFVSGDRERIDPISRVSYRTLMQTLGTEWGRAVHPELWTRVAMAKWIWVKDGCPVDYKQGVLNNVMLGAFSEFKGMVISDVRFDNEAEWIRSAGGIIVHIERPGTEQVGISGHASEAGLRKVPFDLVVRNDGGMMEFNERLHTLCHYLLNPHLRRDSDHVFDVRPGD